MNPTSCSTRKFLQSQVCVMLSSTGRCAFICFFDRAHHHHSRHIHESQNPSGAGGKTPYGGRTPGRTPALGRTPGHVTPGRGGVTPGRQSVRVAPPTNTYSQQPPPQAYPPYGQPPYSGYPPPPRPPGEMPPPPPNGVHPSRAAMIQNSTGASGWGQQSGGW
jgi:transcription elongation factor SPT6